MKTNRLSVYKLCLFMVLFTPLNHIWSSQKPCIYMYIHYIDTQSSYIHMNPPVGGSIALDNYTDDIQTNLDYYE